MQASYDDFVKVRKPQLRRLYPSLSKLELHSQLLHEFNMGNRGVAVNALVAAARYLHGSTVAVAAAAALSAAAGPKGPVKVAAAPEAAPKILVRIAPDPGQREGARVAVAVATKAVDATRAPAVAAAPETALAREPVKAVAVKEAVKSALPIGAAKAPDAARALPRPTAVEVAPVSGLARKQATKSVPAKKPGIPAAPRAMTTVTVTPATSITAVSATPAATTTTAEPERREYVLRHLPPFLAPPSASSDGATDAPYSEPATKKRHVDAQAAQAGEDSRKHVRATAYPSSNATAAVADAGPAEGIAAAKAAALQLYLGLQAVNATKAPAPTASAVVAAPPQRAVFVRDGVSFAVAPNVRGAELVELDEAFNLLPLRDRTTRYQDVPVPASVEAEFAKM